MARADAWTHEEMILVLNLYLKLPFGKMDRRNPDVIHLANIIGRTPNAEYTKRTVPFVYTVNFSMDKDGNFQFENVGQVNGAPSNHMQKCTDVRSDEDCFQFIHPALDEEQSWQIHNEVKRLVISQGIQEICLYLKQMADDKKILLPLNAEKMYNELLRLGMPNGEGYALKTFRNTYKR